MLSCQYVTVNCPHEGCSSTPYKIDLAAHVSSCPSRPISCPNNCGERLLLGAVKEHTNVCTHEVVSCPRSTNCTPTCCRRYRRMDLEDHINSVEYLHLEIRDLVCNLLVHSFMNRN